MNQNINQLYLESKRLILRTWQAQDVKAIFQLFSNQTLSEMSGCQKIHSMKEAEALLSLFQESQKVFALVWKEQNIVIGSVDLETPQFHFDEVCHQEAGKDIGCILHPDYWGNNIMVEATDLVATYCFETLQCEYLCCGHFDDNVQSKRLIKKMGFHYVRDVVFHPQSGGERPGKLYLRKKEEC